MIRGQSLGLATTSRTYLQTGWDLSFAGLKESVGSNSRATPVKDLRNSSIEIRRRPNPGSTIRTASFSSLSKTTKWLKLQWRIAAGSRYSKSSTSMLTPRPRNPYHLAALMTASAVAPSLPGPRMSRISSSRTSLPKYPSTIARLAAPQSVAANCWTTGIFGELSPNRSLSSAGNFSKRLIGSLSLFIGVVVQQFELWKQGHQNASSPDRHFRESLHPVVVVVGFAFGDKSFGVQVRLHQHHRPEQGDAVRQLLAEISARLVWADDFVSHRVDEEVVVGVLVTRHFESQAGAKLDHRPIVAGYQGDHSERRALGKDREDFLAAVDLLPGSNSNVADRPGVRSFQTSLLEIVFRQRLLSPQTGQGLLCRGVERIPQPLDQLEVEFLGDFFKLIALGHVVEAHQDVSGLDAVTWFHLHRAHHPGQARRQLRLAGNSDHRRPGGVLVDGGDHRVQKRRRHAAHQHPIRPSHPGRGNAQQVALPAVLVLVAGERLFSKDTRVGQGSSRSLGSTLPRTPWG